jgi:LPXTG-motif cell wall-anchored protein
MRHWLVLGAVYLVVAALVLPGSLFAAEDPVPAPVGDAASEEPASPAEEPAAENAAPAQPEAPAAETTPAQPAPAPAAPATPAAPPAPAAPQVAAAAPTETVPDEQDPAAAAEVTGEGVRDLPDERAPDKRTRTVVARAADTGNVVISDFKFTPGTVRVVEGDTVVWSNDGPSSHSATAKDGSFDTGVFGKGGSRQATFDNPGTFAYICKPHPFMKGTVVVQSASANTGAQERTDATENADTAADQAIANDTVSDASLPNTGKDVRAMTILALVMVAIGTAIQLRTRRQS